MSKRTILLILILGLSLNWVIGCTSNLLSEQSSKGTISASDLKKLQEYDYRLTHWSATEVATKGTNITITVKNNRIVGSAGCNRYSTTLDENSSLPFGPVTSTKMYCKGDTQKDETRFLKALSTARELQWHPDKLLLVYGKSGETMFFVPYLKQ